MSRIPPVSLKAPMLHAPPADAPATPDAPDAPLRLPAPPSPPPPPAAPPARARPAINFRSVGLGLAGVVLICGLTPYNDYVLNNTFLVGNNLPLGVTMLVFLFTLAVNGPLSRFAPRHALSSGEVAVAFMMMLVSCAVPSSGLMRGFPASLVVPFNEAAADQRYWELLQRLNLPTWLFPTFRDRPPWLDPAVQGFIHRGPAPYGAWVVPILAWAVFTFALYGALLCMVAIVRKQWFENERLPFPLAQIQLSLVDQPRRGRWLNDLMSRRSFWLAFAAVFLLHVWNGLARYFPQRFPEIWVYYDFSRLATEPPWSYTDPKLQNAALFFTVVGATYFITSSVAFSLWFFFVLNNLFMMTKGTWTGDPENAGRMDQHLGGLVAFALTIAWVGRRHWRLVVAQAFRGRRPGEADDRYLSYRTAFWGLVGCAVVMISFLRVAGSTLVAAAVTVGILLTGFLLITRIIAETGLVHGQIYVSFVKPWVTIGAYAQKFNLPQWLHPVPVKSFYLGALVEVQHYDYREVASVYATHGLKVADATVYGGAEEERDLRRDRRTGRALIALLGLSLVVGYFTSFYSTLWTEYRYAFAKDVRAGVINEHGTQGLPQGKLRDYPRSYEESRYYLRHDPATQAGIGFAATAFLSAMRLRYGWWPLHPIGFLMIGTFPGAHLWLSIFVGWLAKTLTLRFGGAKGYVAAKPFFLGLIVGESAAAGFWLLMGIVLSALGLPYRVVNIMPG